MQSHTFSRTLLLGLLLMGSRAAYTQTVSLGFDSLPSAQGWTYVTSGNAVGDSIDEANAFSVNNATLSQNTLSAGQVRAYYQLQNVVSTTQPFEVALRARVLAEDPSPANRFGFGVSVFANGKAFGIGFGTDAIQDYTSGRNAAFDNTKFHDYLIKGTPGGTYDLLADGQVVLSGITSFNGSIPINNGIFLGDTTAGSGANAHAELTKFSYRAAPAPPALVTTLFGAIPGAVLLLRRRKVTG